MMLRYIKITGMVGEIKGIPGSTGALPRPPICPARSIGNKEKLPGGRLVSRLSGLSKLLTNMCCGFVYFI